MALTYENALNALNALSGLSTTGNVSIESVSGFNGGRALVTRYPGADPKRSEVTFSGAKGHLRDGQSNWFRFVVRFVDHPTSGLDSFFQIHSSPPPGYEQDWSGHVIGRNLITGLIVNNTLQIRALRDPKSRSESCNLGLGAFPWAADNQTNDPQFFYTIPLQRQHDYEVVVHAVPAYAGESGAQAGLIQVWVDGQQAINKVGANADFGCYPNASVSRNANGNFYFKLGSYPQSSRSFSHVRWYGGYRFGDVVAGYTAGFSGMSSGSTNTHPPTTSLDPLRCFTPSDEVVSTHGLAALPQQGASGGGLSIAQWLSAWRAAKPAPPNHPSSGASVTRVNSAASLRAAIGSASAGDIIYVLPGLDLTVGWSDTAVIGRVGTASAPIVITSDPDNRATLRGQFSFKIWRSHHLEISNLILRNTAGYPTINLGDAVRQNAATGGGPLVDSKETSSYVDILNVSIFDGTLAGIKVTGHSHHVRIIGTEVGAAHSRYTEGIYLGDGNSNSNYVIDKPHDVLIAFCEIYEREDEAIEIKAGAYNVQIVFNYIHDIAVGSQGAITTNWRTLDLPTGITESANVLIHGNLIDGVKLDRNRPVDQQSEAQGMAIGGGDTVVSDNIIANIEQSKPLNVPIYIEARCVSGYQQVKLFNNTLKDEPPSSGIQYRSTGLFHPPSNGAAALIEQSGNSQSGGSSPNFTPCDTPPPPDDLVLVTPPPDITRAYGTQSVLLINPVVTGTHRLEWVSNDPNLSLEQQGDQWRVQLNAGQTGVFLLSCNVVGSSETLITNMQLTINPQTSGTQYGRVTESLLFIAQE